jgi:ABC-type transport system involved in cytochrome bd biosynthesis fused ATPase/permease subunit
MRLNNRDTRLVVVDEGTSNLDPVTERDILSEFRKSRSGKTMIFITHQYHHLAKDADQILYVYLLFILTNVVAHTSIPAA